LAKKGAKTLFWCKKSANIPTGISVKEQEFDAETKFSFY